jgi:sacsin
LLRLLPADISDEDREVILVPDVNFALRPLPSVCYNDVGKHGHLFGLDDVYIAHPAVDENLAKCLGMRRLGLQLPDCQPPDDDMGEQLMTTIRNKLREYTERQIFTEFFANAADAGATKFGIMVDKQPGPTEHILSQDMAAFQTCPALIIHNDATFSEADFHGIIKTGIGGKEARSDTIGQFGFGALTMFHFTEVSFVSSQSMEKIYPQF